MSALTLHTEPGNFRAFKILIAAEYNGITINMPTFKLGETNKTDAFLKISPAGKVPAMETKNGSIFESNAIARYVARLRQDTGLYGATFFESAQVDQWIDFCSTAIELPASLWFYPVLGMMAANASVTEKAKADLCNALCVLDAHLAARTYLVGDAITLADITLASTLVYPFKFVCDPAYRAAHPSVCRWFETCVNQPQFEAVVGKVVLATKENAAGTGKALPAPKAKKAAWDGVKKEKVEKPKKEKAPKPPAPPKVEKEEEEEEKPKAKKEEHPFKIMDAEKPTKFVMDAWKRAYSNCETYEAGMAEFWQMADLEGWSLFRGDYKYNHENKVLFMTSNLIGGFIQRTEEIRKWLFGTMTIRGDEEKKDLKITAYYLIRGDSIQPLINCNDDAACYTWTRLATPVSEKDKALLAEYWTNEFTLEGETLLDSRCYK